MKVEMGEVDIADLAIFAGIKTEELLYFTHLIKKHQADLEVMKQAEIVEMPVLQLIKRWPLLGRVYQAQAAKLERLESQSGYWSLQILRHTVHFSSTSDSDRLRRMQVEDAAADFFLRTNVFGYVETKKKDTLGINPIGWVRSWRKRLID